MKSSNIGGQAVLEGIMMKNGEDYAVAVRKPDGEIVLEKDTYTSVIPWKLLTKIPFVRGIFGFVDSLVLGMRTLTFSSSFYEEEEKKDEDGNPIVKTEEEEAKDKRKEDVIMGITMIASVIIAIGVFMVLPYGMVDFMGRWIHSHLILSVIEGAIRIGIFVAYILLISRMEDIHRTFMYHGAEHKCINCIEHGLDLTVENVRRSSKEHKRCGTSFIFFIFIISIVLLFFIRTDSRILRVIIRLALIPVIAGISYELIKWAGNSENKFISALSIPGLWMQKLTTKEPDDSMIEVAIEAVEAVFDWKQYLAENFSKEKDSVSEG